MTDYFRLLGQARRPWLDENELKNAYHARTFDAHPDVNPGGDAAAFAGLNEAYRTLRDPKLRVEHLLHLEESNAGTGAGSVPAVVQELFPMVTTALQNARALTAKLAQTGSALSRGLLQGENVACRHQIERCIEQLTVAQDQAEKQLRAIDKRWDDRVSSDIEELRALAATYSYINRWSAQLDEARFALQSEGSPI
ncbi:MAG: J domain-containing protein [Chthoniobacterales bacterium]